MVRQATLSDIDQIIAWGREFHTYGPWRDRVPFVEADLRVSIGAMLESENGAVFIDDNGMCGGILFPMYFNLSHLVAQELFWWSKDGREVREAFEAWAMARGASSIQMSCLADDRESATRRLFRIRGYRPIETSLWKEAC